MGFFFYPLRRLKLFTSAHVSRIIFYFHLVLRSLIPRGREHGLHAARSSRLVETFLLLDLRTFSFPQHLNFLLFFPPPLGDHFSIFNDTLQAPNSPLLPWSTLWHFTCQVLSAVAKVTSSVFCSSFRGEDISPFYISSQRLNLPVSLVSSPFYAFFLQRLAFPSNRRTSHAAQKPAVLPLTPSSKPTPFIKACSARCFFPHAFFLLEAGFTLANPPISTFIGAPGISLAPFPLSFWRRKAIFSVLRLLPRGGWVCSWSTVAFSKFSCCQSQHSGSAFPRFFFVNRLRLASS